MASTTTARSPHPSLKRVPPPSSQIRVVVRIRPFLPSELAACRDLAATCVSVLDDPSEQDEVTVRIKDQFSSRNECYKLDAFFEQRDNLGGIFSREVGPVLPALFRGRNATVFAYGATGSGKTYTMQGTEEHPGLIPQAVSSILEMCQEAESSVEICYYEIYLDRCYDLLEPKAKEIPVLEDKDGNVQLKGLCSVPIHSMPEFLEAFSCGVQRRKVAHTGLNDVSSRSHAVLSVVVSSAGGDRGKLNLIDLAGNEDNRRTCNEGIRLQESAKINQSLFALSNVIYALNNNEPRIPYRESKLTRILQDSLGGTSRALMVACLNPGSYPEAVHTVSLAARSRHIGSSYVGPKQETPKVKVDMEAKLLAWLESKGKTKSIHRLNGARSPFPGSIQISASCSMSNKLSGNKLPSSISKLKRMEFSKGSASRKLFDPTTSISTVGDENAFECEVSAGYKSSLDLDGDVLNGMPYADLAMESPLSSVHDQIELCINESNTSHALVTSSSIVPTDTRYESTIPENFEQDKPNNNISNGHLGNHEVISILDKENIELKVESSIDNCLQTPVSKIGTFPSVHEKTHDLQNSTRSVLSPVHLNMSQFKHSEDDDSFYNMPDFRTPKATGICKPGDAEPHITSTPLDKFNILGSNLKDSLAKEYLAFLNVASKEELLALKGIGRKRAEYIFELRETTPQPFESLEDLEKIGLSSRQAHDLLRRAASGIFS